MIRHFWKTILFLVCIFATQILWSDTNAKSSTLQLIEIKQRQQQTTLIYTLKGTAEPKIFMLHNPERLVIDFPSTQASSVLPKEIHTNGEIERMRLGTGPQGPGNLRLVHDLSLPSTYIFLIDQNPQKTQEIVTVILTKTAAAPAPKVEQKSPYHENLDMAALDAEMAATQKTKVYKTSDIMASGPPDLIETLRENNYASIKTSPMKKVEVVLDPGHGGKDPGAVGANKTMEKTVVLSIARKLQKYLNTTPGIQADMTRKGDYFLNLRRRINIARHDKADMFMSIHADAFNETASGASVFALSQHGATSEAARWIAERENTSELSGISLKTKDKELKSVLLDMSQTATIQDSVQLGNSVLAALKPLTPLHSDEVEQAGFVVLKSPDIPSVLVETGFLSNPSEEKLLIQPQYQDRIAKALAIGITKYFQENPPPGSLFEMQYAYH